jgi:hypothetical protein
MHPKRDCALDENLLLHNNVFVERVLRSVKYERVYLKAYDSVSAAHADIADYIHWYNTGRPHPSLADVTPEAANLDWLPKLAEAVQCNFRCVPRCSAL